jgi:hypothetical protein
VTKSVWDEVSAPEEAPAKEQQVRRTWAQCLGEGLGHQADGGFVLPLVHPVQFGQQTVSELRFREARGKDYRACPMRIDSAPMGALLDFGARLCGQTPQIINELRGIDMTRFMEVTSAFFAGTPRAIGTEPSGSSPGTSTGESANSTT